MESKSKTSKYKLQEFLDLYVILATISLTLFPIYYTIIITFKIASGSKNFSYNPLTNIKQLIKIIKTKEIWIQ